MAVTVVLPRSLVSLIPGTCRSTEIEASSVAEAIDRLDELTPGLRNRLVDSGPTIRQHIKSSSTGRWRRSRRHCPRTPPST